MSEYLVSARKYRPQTFDTVVGQEHITTTLKNAIRTRHLAHAFLFCGPRGVGKTTCARILARTINCEHPTDDMEACGVCPTCKSFTNNTSFNIFELDAASNNSVDDIRNLIDQVRFAPQQGQYKIYIIDEVHMLSAAAFNAFLKTLEEPPPYAIFILATTEKHKILPTILSRCQIFDFRRITTRDITNYLAFIATSEHVTASEAALHVVAQKSEGCMRDALSMFDRIAGFTSGNITYANIMEHLNMLDAAFYFDLTDYMLSQDVAGALLLLSDTLDKGFEGDTIIAGLAEHMRNLLLCKDDRMARLLDVPNDHKHLYYEKACQAPPSFVLSALNVINDAELHYKAAHSKRLHVELCLIRLCYLLQAVKGAAIPIPVGDLTPTHHSAARLPGPSTPPAPAAGAVAASEHPEIALVAAPVTPYKAPASAATLPPRDDEKHTPSAMKTGRKVTASIMTSVDQSMSTAVAAPPEQKVLVAEAVTEVYQTYVAKLKAENQTVHYAQFADMYPELASPDEVRIVTSNDLAETYAKDRRNQLIDYFRVHTGIKNLRVTITVRKDDKQKAPVEAVMTRQETYDALAQTNPWLATLRDGLNLQIEY